MFQTNVAKISSILCNHEIPTPRWLCKNTHECKNTSNNVLNMKTRPTIFKIYNFDLHTTFEQNFQFPTTCMKITYKLYVNYI